MKILIIYVILLSFLSLARICHHQFGVDIIILILDFINRLVRVKEAKCVGITNIGLKPLEVSKELKERGPPYTQFYVNTKYIQKLREGKCSLTNWLIKEGLHPTDEEFKKITLKRASEVPEKHFCKGRGVDFRKIHPSISHLGKNWFELNQVGKDKNPIKFINHPDHVKPELPYHTLGFGDNPPLPKLYIFAMDRLIWPDNQVIYNYSIPKSLQVKTLINMFNSHDKVNFPYNFSQLIKIRDRKGELLYLGECYLIDPPEVFRITPVRSPFNIWGKGYYWDYLEDYHFGLDYTPLDTPGYPKYKIRETYYYEDPCVHVDIFLRETDPDNPANQN